MSDNVVVGLDRTPCSTAGIVGDIRDKELLQAALEGVDVVVHCASLHAPHVGIMSDRDFFDINVDATESIMRTAMGHSVGHFVYTSTTALYGDASNLDGQASWIDETVEPLPRTIYHRTKIAAEKLLEKLSVESGIPVTVLRMSRCFPEPADQMAVFRLHRGIDVRDVASAHKRVIQVRPPGFRRFIVSGATPFQRRHCKELSVDAARLLRLHVPALATEFDRRGWQLPTSIDRVYDAGLAQKELGWVSQHGFESVLAMLDDGIPEVLPVG